MAADAAEAALAADAALLAWLAADAADFAWFAADAADAALAAEAAFLAWLAAEAADACLIVTGAFLEELETVATVANITKTLHKPSANVGAGADTRLSDPVSLIGLGAALNAILPPARGLAALSAGLEPCARLIARLTAIAHRRALGARLRRLGGVLATVSGLVALRA